MQFIADVREIQAADNAAVRWRGRIDVHHQQRVAARFMIWCQGGDVRETLRRRFHRQPGSWIECRIRGPSETRLPERGGLSGLLGLRHRNLFGGSVEGIRKLEKNRPASRIVADTG